MLLAQAPAEAHGNGGLGRGARSADMPEFGQGGYQPCAGDGTMKRIAEGFGSGLSGQDGRRAGRIEIDPKPRHRQRVWGRRERVRGEGCGAKKLELESPGEGLYGGDAGLRVVPFAA